MRTLTLMDAERPYVGLDFDERRVRRLAALEVHRTTDMAVFIADQFLTDYTWPERARMADVCVPTLGMHGTTDPMFPFEHGRALARSIPDATLVELDGVGHQQPPPERWDIALAAVAAHTAGR